MQGSPLFQFRSTIGSNRGANQLNIEAFANYAEIVGGITVLISLIYVGIQIRSNTKSTLSQTNMMAHESMANFSLEAAKDSATSALIRKGLVDFSALNTDEQFQFLVLMTSLYRRFENVYYQYNKGLLESELWDGYHHSLRAYTNTPGGREFWTLRKDSFSPSFREFIDKSDVREHFIPQ